MKFNPIALFTSLTVVAAGAAGYMAFHPTMFTSVRPLAVVSDPAPVAETPVVEAPAVEAPVVKPVVTEAPVTKAPVVEAPKAEAPAVEPPPTKPAEQVAAVTQPVAQPEPTPAIVVPSFDTVRVEIGGDAVIAGRAQPDTEVVAKLNGVAIATAMASADGSFVMIPDNPLPAGAGVLSLETTVAGEVIASTTTVAVAVKPKGQGETTVAVLAPDQPTKILQAPASPSKSVVLDAVDYNTAGDIVFSGRSQPGSVVRLYVDNAIAGEAKADDSGRWTYAGKSEVPAGQHMLRADAVTADGSVSSRVELPFLREAPAIVAEAVAPAAAAPVPAPIAQPAPAPVVAAAPAVVTTAPVAAAPQTTTAAAPAVVAKVPEAVVTAQPAPPTPVVSAPGVVAQPPALVATAQPATVSTAPQPTRIVIQPGNNLWRLSRELYGYGRKYTVIYEANKDQIRNPRLIFPGQILTAPVIQGTTP